MTTDPFYIGVYGSLKKGQYNHPIIGKDPEFVTKIKGVMFRVSSYPVLFEEVEGFEPRQYDLEIYEVDYNTYKLIDSMEVGAGYVEKEIDIDGLNVSVYFGHPDYFKQSKELYVKKW